MSLKFRFVAGLVGVVAVSGLVGCSSNDDVVPDVSGADFDLSALGYLSDVKSVNGYNVKKFTGELVGFMSDYAGLTVVEKPSTFAEGACFVGSEVDDSKWQLSTQVEFERDYDFLTATEMLVEASVMVGFVESFHHSYDANVNKSIVNESEDDLGNELFIMSDPDGVVTLVLVSSCFDNVSE